MKHEIHELIHKVHEHIEGRFDLEADDFNKIHAILSKYESDLSAAFEAGGDYQLYYSRRYEGAPLKPNKEQYIAKILTH